MVPFMIGPVNLLFPRRIHHRLKWKSVTNVVINIKVAKNALEVLEEPKLVNIQGFKDGHGINLKVLTTL